MNMTLLKKDDNQVYSPKQDNLLKEQSYKRHLQKGITEVSAFAQDTKDMDKLDNAVYFLNRALNLIDTKPDPYFYLSWCFYLANDLKEAKRNYYMCQHINPDFEGLKKLGQNLF